MKTLTILAMAAMLSAAPAAHAQEARFSHFVLFALKADSAEERQTLIAEMKKYLKGHPGEVAYSTGVVAEDMDRDVNVKDFDVSLHIVFENKAAHDAYQVAPRHKEFIAANAARWDNVRVIDTYVSAD